MSESDPKLGNRILIGLAIGAVAGAATLVVGAWSPAVLEVARSISTRFFDPLGQVFLRLLFFVIVASLSPAGSMSFFTSSALVCTEFCAMAVATPTADASLPRPV